MSELNLNNPPHQATITWRVRIIYGQSDIDKKDKRSKDSFNNTNINKYGII